MEKFRPVCAPSLVLAVLSVYQCVTPLTVRMLLSDVPNRASGADVGLAAS